MVLWTMCGSSLGCSGHRQMGPLYSIVLNNKTLDTLESFKYIGGSMLRLIIDRMNVLPFGSEKDTLLCIEEKWSVGLTYTCLALGWHWCFYAGFKYSAVASWSSCRKSLKISKIVFYEVSLSENNFLSMLLILESGSLPIECAYSATRKYHIA